MSTREVDQRGGYPRAFAPAFVDDVEESEDKFLTVAFKRGEKGAYQAIHDRYAARVHGVCRRMLLHPEDAEEAAQESFLRVYQALGRFNGRYLLGPWITRITTNVCLDHLRAKGRRPVDLVPVEILDVQLNGDGELDPQELHVRRAEGRRVRKLLESLPPLYRAAIVLRDFEGLSYAEVAAALQITEPQTKALIHRARQAFKRSWSSALLALPLRFLNRVKRLETSAREQGNNAAASVQHTSDVAASAVQAASSCSTLVQQCGQLLAERAAVVATAVMIGTGAAATVSAPAQTAPHEPAPARPAIVAEADADLTKLVAARVVHGRDKDERAPAEEAPVADEPDPAPTPVVDPTPPAEEPAQAPASDPTEAPPAESGGGGGQPAPSPSPSASPTPSPLPPPGFTLAFDVTAPGAPSVRCGCAGATKVQTSQVGVTTAGIERLDQVLTGTASLEGNPTYGLWIDHYSASGTAHNMDFRLYTSEGGYFYTASGTLVDRVATAWSGWQYTYRGTYRLTSRPGSTEKMPSAGSYTLVVSASWGEDRVVSTDFVIHDGG